jgi:hypothetical protein
MSLILPSEPDALNWHDGILVDVRMSELANAEPRFTLLVDLYPDTDPGSVRRRYEVSGVKPVRFVLTGDLARLNENAKAGNIDRMRIDHTAETEILVVSLFGGMIEVEASSFGLTEYSR